MKLPAQQQSKWLRLATAVLLVIAIWGYLLPKLTHTQTVRDREQFLEQHQINPAATFYTELPCLEPSGVSP